MKTKDRDRGGVGGPGGGREGHTQDFSQRVYDIGDLKKMEQGSWAEERDGTRFMH